MDVKSLNKTIFKYIFVTSLISILMVSIMLIIYQYMDFKNHSKELRDSFMSFQKSLIKDKVEDTVNYISTNVKSLESNLKKTLKERVELAHSIAMSIYNENKDVLSDDKIKGLIVTTLKHIKFSDKRDYYFINENSGISVLFNRVSQLGKNIDVSNLKNSKGEFFIQKQIEIAKNQKEGFLYSSFLKPDLNDSIQYSKLSYIKLFEPFDWHIGTGKYLDDEKKKLQDRLLNYIADIRFGTDGNNYIYVNQKDGYSLIFDGRRNRVPFDMKEIKDIDGEPVFSKLLNCIENGEFFTYYFKKLNSPELSFKLGFAKEVKEFDWIVGSGTHLDIIDNILLEKSAKLRSQIFINLIITFFITSLIVILIYFISKRLAFYFDLNIIVLTNSIKDASYRYVKIDARKLTFKEFRKLAISFNHMLVLREKAENKLKEINNSLEKKIEFETKKRLEQERILSHQSKMALMGEMISAIAHQWRQPLNVLIIILHDLEEAQEFNELNEEYLQNSIDKATKQIEFMSKTIDDFRSFFKINKLKIEFNVVDTIRESISILQAQFKNHSIDLKFDTEDEIKIFNYPNELKQVFLNLLNNSKDAILEIKATDKNFFGVIEVIVIKLEDGVQIDIIDNAGGIKDDVMDRIFEPYFTTKEQGKGTGIGLYMSKLIIENMKGSIYCKNSNNGAIFTIILPWKT